MVKYLENRLKYLVQNRVTRLMMIGNLSESKVHALYTHYYYPPSASESKVQNQPIPVHIL